MKKIQGVFPPLITIFDEERNIDFNSMKRHIDFLIKKGVDGIALLGTTGEFFSLSIDEKKFLVNNVLDYINGKIKVIVGVGDTNSSTVFEFMKFLENKEIEALLIINPYYVVYDEDTIVKYFSEICNRTSKKVIIYNFPLFTGFNFTSNIVRRIASNNSNLVGIKETIDDLEHVKTMIELKKEFENFSVFCAFENQALDALNLGVDGFINATSNFAPEFTVNTFKYFKEGNDKLTRENFLKMKDAMKIFEYSKPLLLACKQAVYDRVINEDRFEKLPAYSLSETKKKELKKELKNLNIL